MSDDRIPSAHVHNATGVHRTHRRVPAPPRPATNCGYVARFIAADSARQICGTSRCPTCEHNKARQ